MLPSHVFPRRTAQFFTVLLLCPQTPWKVLLLPPRVSESLASGDTAVCVHVTPHVLVLWV